jgi:hypothetical protein
MARRSSLRASDADRDWVAERLKQAATEGRILANELEERLATALRARTYGDLDDVVADLPGARPTKPTSRSRSRQLLVAHPIAGVAVLAAAALVVIVVAVFVFLLAGLWLVLARIVFAHRGQHLGPPGRGGYGRRPYGPPLNRGRYGGAPAHGGRRPQANPDAWR